MCNKNVVYCGMDCSLCPIYISTIHQDNEKIKEVLKLDNHCDIHNYQCLGCMSNQISIICKDCFIKNCNNNKKLNNCSECNDFPCDYLKNNISKETMNNLIELKKM